MASCTSCSSESPKPLCPARMSDGRTFTDYRPRCAVNSELLGALKNPKSSFESRMYLQQNAETVMELGRQRAIDVMAPCAPCTRPFSDPGTMLPERYVVKCDEVTCSRTEVNPQGLGDGRSY